MLFVSPLITVAVSKGFTCHMIMSHVIIIIIIIIIVIIIIIHLIYIALFWVPKVASHTIKSFNKNSKE